MTINRLPNPMKKVIFGNYTFPLDSAIFADNINDESQEYPAFFNLSDLKRVKSAIYDSNNNMFFAQYHEKITKNQQNLFIEAQENYFLDWLKSLSNSKAKETIEFLNKMSQGEKKAQDICEHYKSIVPETSQERIMLKTIDEETLDFIKNRAYVYRVHKIGHNESSDESG